MDDIYEKCVEKHQTAWFSVEEIIPMEDVDVLVFTKEGYYYVANWNDYSGWSCCGCEVTHYRPLPTPPANGVKAIIFHEPYDLTSDNLWVKS